MIPDVHFPTVADLSKTAITTYKSTTVKKKIIV